MKHRPGGTETSGLQGGVGVLLHNLLHCIRGERGDESGDVTDSASSLLHIYPDSTSTKSLVSKMSLRSIQKRRKSARATASAFSGCSNFTAAMSLLALSDDLVVITVRKSCAEYS
ncbi:hypothetical protein PFISCL1PPCAC_4419, partial [Pristionchus fissidentatus]